MARRCPLLTLRPGRCETGQPIAAAESVDFGIRGFAPRLIDVIEFLLNQDAEPVNRNSIKWSMRISVRQIKAARALLAWSQEDLAAQSGVSYPTIARLETSDGGLGGRADTAAKIIEALEGAGVIFVAENGEGAGVRLKKKKK